ncbi:hypothetical protein HPB48_012920 [Haemaphysalis longicornis]|uniref:Uncharacterized protein n=1 Tax=Haemaphysalis longicornis TaxID=44386 RepID=A0A9J6FNF4_HAELO|nr:hypothetical protein HPB48_012920 [Haemaphysalis longicornis]
MSSETDSRWQTVYHSRRRSQDLATIVIRPSGIPLAKIKPTELMQALAAAAYLTPSEITDSILQPRPQQNLIAVKTFQVISSTEAPSHSLLSPCLNESPCHNVRSSSHRFLSGCHSRRPSWNLSSRTTIPSHLHWGSHHQGLA